MENLSGHSKTELQKLGNDIKDKHDAIKEEIISYSYEMERLENLINEKVAELKELEKNYVEVVEKLIE